MTRLFIAIAALGALAAPALAQSDISPTDKYSWGENIGWMNWYDAVAGARGVFVEPAYLAGYIWCENVGWLFVGDGSPADTVAYSNSSGADFGVNIIGGGELFGYAWGENIGWVNFGGGALATPARPARLDVNARRFRGFAWSENAGWINLNDATHFVAVPGLCGSADFDGDGDAGTDADIEAFFACLGGDCCATCGSADFDADGDTGTDADIETFFTVLGGGTC